MDLTEGEKVVLGWLTVGARREASDVELGYGNMGIAWRSMRTFLGIFTTRQLKTGEFVTEIPSEGNSVLCEDTIMADKQDLNAAHFENIARYFASGTCLEVHKISTQGPVVRIPATFKDMYLREPTCDDDCRIVHLRGRRMREIEHDNKNAILSELGWENIGWEPGKRFDFGELRMTPMESTDGGGLVIGPDGSVYLMKDDVLTNVPTGHLINPSHPF